MKLKSLAGMLAGLAMTFGATATFSEPSQANSNSNSNSNTYYCAQLNGIWNTFVNTPRGRITLINWVRNHSEDWTPQRRCLEVSKRFQKFLEDGTLKYIRTGTVNRQPVICVANDRGGACPDRNVLVTFKPGTDPEEVLIQLVDFRRSVSGQTIVLSENDSGFYADGEFYVDLAKFLDTVPVSNQTTNE
jgi:hypothetical protein